MEQKHSPLVILGFILGGSLVVASLVGAFTIFKIRSLSDVVSVTGSAKVAVTADQAKWTTQISRTVRIGNLKIGYQEIAKDLDTAKIFMKEQGIDGAELTTSPVSMNEQYQQDQSAEKIYTLVQTLEVQSADVQKITRASNNAVQVINKGVIFSTLSLEYFYSKLPETRIALLSQAISDAKARAGEVAKNSDKKIGSLKSATSGVVQVQSLNSTDVSDYGSYDTSKIDKQVTVTVKASFSLK